VFVVTCSSFVVGISTPFHVFRMVSGERVLIFGIARSAPQHLLTEESGEAGGVLRKYPIPVCSGHSCSLTRFTTVETSHLPSQYIVPVASSLLSLRLWPVKSFSSRQTTALLGLHIRPRIALLRLDRRRRGSFAAAATWFGRPDFRPGQPGNKRSEARAHLGPRNLRLKHLVLHVRTIQAEHTT
jgi:hypothetical protein